MPLPLSVSIVCKNNEATIGRTLESVAGLASEIVAVDSGSTDGTIALLERHGARVIRSEWRGYVATKQMALEACTQEWVLALDSDESVEPDLREDIEAQVSINDDQIYGYRMNRRVWYRGRPLRHAWQPEWRLRLVRRRHARWAGLDPHDHLVLVDVPGMQAASAADDERMRALRGTLRHDSIGTFAEFLAKQASHARVMARSLHASGKRGSRASLVVSPPGAFVKQLVLKGAWRDGWPGWLAAASAAAGALMKHAILLELSHPTSDTEDAVDPGRRPA